MPDFRSGEQIALATASAKGRNHPFLGVGLELYLLVVEETTVATEDVVQIVSDRVVRQFPQVPLHRGFDRLPDWSSGFPGYGHPVSARINLLFRCPSLHATTSR